MSMRVLLAKIGIDGHDAGIKVVAAALRDAGLMSNGNVLLKGLSGLGT